MFEAQVNTHEGEVVWRKRPKNSVLYVRCSVDHMERVEKVFIGIWRSTFFLVYI